MEQASGIEPPSATGKAADLPLIHACVYVRDDTDSLTYVCVNLAFEDTFSVAA